MESMHTNNMYKITTFNRDEFLAPFSSLFDEMLQQHSHELATDLGSEFFQKGSYPKVDLIEYDDRLVLEADVSGLTRADVSADIEGDYLIIRGGKKTAPESDKNVRYVYREIKRSSFQRSFLIGDSIDKKKITADFKDGTLVVVLPRLKPEEKKPAKVKLL